MTDIDFPVDYEESGWILAVIRGRLMRSPDRGITWDEIVRGFGGEAQKIRAVDISAADPSVVYSVSRAGEVLRSDDTGVSWDALPAPAGMLPAQPVASAADPDVVLVLGTEPNSAARSGDGGQTWTSVEIDGATLGVVAAAAEPGGALFVADLQGRVLVGDVDGSSWTVQGRVSEGHFRTLDLVETDESVVMFGTTNERHLYRSDDRGVSWDLVGDGLPDEQLFSVSPSSMFPADDTVWVSTRQSGPYRSVDGGRTFLRLGQGLSRSVQADDVNAPHFTTIAAAPDESGIVLIAGFDGLFLLAPGTDSWAAVETLTGYIAGLDLSPNYVEDATIAVMTYVRGAFISNDGGDTWMFANDGLLVDGIDEGNRFAPIRRMHNVHFSPTYADDDTIFSANWVRLQRSTDGGRSWEQIPIGDPPEGSPLRQFVLATSPAYASDTTVFAATRQGEFFASTKAGERDSWELLSTFDTRVRSIGVSPAIDTDGTIFVGTTSGLFRSRDGGRTWFETSVRNVAEVTGRETDVGVQVVVSPDFTSDGTVYATTDSGLYRSVDGGDSWSEVHSGPLDGTQLIEAVAFSPNYGEDGLILVSIRGGGLARTVDHGESFESTGASLDELNLLIADYANPTSNPIQFSPTYAEDDTIFAYAQQELVRSTDAGETWEIVELPSDAEVLASLPDFEPAGDGSTLAETSPMANDGVESTGPGDNSDDGADADDDAGDDVTGVDDGDDADDEDSGDGGAGWVLWVALVAVVGAVGIVVLRRR